MIEQRRSNPARLTSDYLPRFRKKFENHLTGYNGRGGRGINRGSVFFTASFLVSIPAAVPLSRFNLLFMHKTLCGAGAKRVERLARSILLFAWRTCLGVTTFTERGHGARVSWRSETKGRNRGLGMDHTFLKKMVSQPACLAATPMTPVE